MLERGPFTHNSLVSIPFIHIYFAYISLTLTSFQGYAVMDSPPCPRYRLLADAHHQLSKTAVVYLRAYLTTVQPFFPDSESLDRAISTSWMNSRQQHAALITPLTSNIELYYMPIGVVCYL